MPDPVVSDALVTDPAQVAAVLAAVLAAVFALERLPALARVFAVLPGVLWAYFVPTLLTAAGITPQASPAYDAFSYALLPMSLFLVMLSVDLRAVASLGRMATVMMLVGAGSIVLGAPIAYLAVGQFIADPDAWKGLAALSGSWIGGTANMLAVQESVGLKSLGPIIVVDTVVAYGWMAVLLALARRQGAFDRWVGADPNALDSVNAALARVDTERRPATTASLAVIIGLGGAAAVTARTLGAALPPLGTPPIVTAGTWAVLIAVTAGLLLSATPLRRLEADGASRVGYTALYLLLTSVGAQADLASILDAPLYLLAGLVWLAVHIVLLVGAAKLLRAPLFFVATASMAGIGGPVSAPVVAGTYHRAMAPVGLLMAVAGYVLGIYGGIAVSWMLGQLAG
ncbi:MAG TPA: DUF819 family protein [Rubricoccaceae bacterium]|jgi:uncharacterized membrane protein